MSRAGLTVLQGRRPGRLALDHVIDLAVLDRRAAKVPRLMEPAGPLASVAGCGVALRAPRFHRLIDGESVVGRPEDLRDALVRHAGEARDRPVGEAFVGGLAERLVTLRLRLAQRLGRGVHVRGGLFEQFGLGGGGLHV